MEIQNLGHAIRDSRIACQSVHSLECFLSAVNKDRPATEEESLFRAALRELQRR